MSIQLTTFTKNYEQSINLLKSIKQSNQRLQQKIPTDYRHEQYSVETAKNKIQLWIIDMEKQYLDPQTARRLEIIKQQLNTEYQKYKQFKNKLSGEYRQSADNKQIGQYIESSEEENDRYNLLLSEEHTMTKQRTRQLSAAQNKLQNIHSITEDTKTLTYHQGEQVDIINQHIALTLERTKQTNSALEEAKRQQRKSNKKYMWVIVTATVAVVVVIVFVVVLV